jgi:putative transposase
MIFHVLNRGVARHDLFHRPGDFLAFERILAEALARVPGVQLLAYCLMSNHWHLELLPSADGELSELMRWLTVTHTQRYHACHHTAGTGHIYQGRFKSFPVEETAEAFFPVTRYVERNALRANLVERAEDWRWCSLWRRENGRTDLPLADWPIKCPADWVQLVNAPQTAAELTALRRSLTRGRPFGSTDEWELRTATVLGLLQTLRNPGRPRKGRREDPSDSAAAAAKTAPDKLAVVTPRNRIGS